MNISETNLKIIRSAQQGECNESEVYRRIAMQCKSENNKKILERLSQEEKKHELIWQKYTGIECKYNAFLVFLRVFTAKLFGFTFSVKLMENNESKSQIVYDKLATECPEALQIKADEEAHENALLGMLDEERLRYVGSMVLGLNDALVELTGTLAGLTLALQNTRIIALSGLITGISATLSMASSEFLSAKSEGRTDALKSCTYTGLAYLATVALLILPYLLFDPEHFLYALVSMLVIVLLIILVFNFYISVAKDYHFGHRFAEMAGISIGVAVLSFGIGLLVKMWLGVDI